MPRRLSIALVLFSMSAGAFAADTSWKHWRGPHYDGSVEAGAFGDAPFGLRLAWRRPLGPAYSAIAVDAERGLAVTLESDGSDDFLVALDIASGAERWRSRIDATYRGHDGSHDGGHSTPAIGDGAAYILGPNGQLVAARIENGAKLWRRDLVADFGAVQPDYGFASSPLLVDDLVVVAVGGGTGKAFVAFDRATGTERWRAGDEAVTYQSPLLVELGGERQILALSNLSAAGLDPVSGEVLWQQPFGERESGTARALPLPEDRLLIQAGRDAALFAYRSDHRDRGGEPLEELWRTNALAGGLGTAVHHDGHLYGFAGDFLTCLDATSGERVWKSRPPGGGSLILVDGRLVALGKGGEVVVAAASPEGYRELARTAATEATGATYPTFGAGLILVRTVGEIAAVAKAPPPPPTAAPAPAKSAFEAFVRELETARNPAALIDDFMRRQQSFPVREGEQVHFLYRGPAEDVAIAGAMTENGDEDGMARVPGTDLFHRSYRIPPASRLEYWLNVDFENRGPDPLNPRRRRYERWWWDFDVSELAPPDFQEPAAARPYRGDAPGRIERFEHQSEAAGDTRSIDVYLPPGYDPDGAADYPLVVVAEGDMWLARGDFASVLDNRIAAGASPALVALVHRAPGSDAWQEYGYAKADAYVRMLAEELVPALEQRYRLRSEPGSRVLLGRRTGAYAAVETALAHPRVFGAAAAITVDCDRETCARLEALVRATSPGGSAPTRFFVRWHAYDGNVGFGADDLVAKNRELGALLASRGFAVDDAEVPGGGGWGAWPALAAEALDTLLP